MLRAGDGGGDGEVSDVAEGSQSFTSKTQGAQVGKAAKVAELGGGVALAEEGEVLGLFVVEVVLMCGWRKRSGGVGRWRWRKESGKKGRETQATTAPFPSKFDSAIKK